MIKVTFNKQTGSDEGFTAEIELQNPSEWVSHVTPVMNHIDKRLKDRGKMYLAAQVQMDKMTDEEFEKFRNTYYLLTGVPMPPRAGEEK